MGSRWGISLLVAFTLLTSSCTNQRATTRELFAQKVLGEARIPPDARATNTVVSPWLEHPLETPGSSGLIDLHRQYLVDRLPGAVESYIEAHLPDGAKVTSTESSGGPAGTAIGLVVSLPISGPNEYLAQLAYDVAPATTHAAELRIDAQTVWVPNRSAGEFAPAQGIVDVTGYSSVSVASGSSGPVTVQLSSRRASGLRAVLNALPLGPAVGCLEGALLYKIAVRPTAGGASSFEADGYACGATVLVTEHGRRKSPLHDAHCSLLHAVIDLLPAHMVNGTRFSTAGCTT